MLQMMRNQTFIKTLMWIIIIAFVAWLGIELGYGGGGPVGSNPKVGEVEGEPIYWANFRKEMGQLRDYQRRQNEETIVDDFDLDEQIWQQSVRRALLARAVDRMGITVSADELAQAMIFNPPGGFDKIPDFQTPDKQFDREKYRQFLAEMTDERWFQITGMTFADYQEQLRFEVRVEKLRRQIQDAGFVTEADIRQAYADQNEKITVKTIAAPVSLISDQQAAVTDEDIRSYYEEHLDEYRQPARARLEYVVISKKPSVGDSTRARAEIDDIYRQLAGGADFATLAGRFSEDPGSAREGGSLGTFGRGQMVPEFDSTAFALGEGQYGAPIHTRFGWHIVKTERKVKGATTAQDSVQARHILIRADQPGAGTLDSLMSLSESLQKAPNFARAARAKGLEPKTTPYFDKDVVFPIPEVPETVRRLVRWAFTAEKGAVASPTTTQNAIVVARLDNRVEAGPQPLDEVKDRIRTTVLLLKKVDAAAKMLEPIAQKVRQGVPMEQAVAGTQFAVVQIGPFTRSQYLPEVQAGAWDGFAGAAFALAQPNKPTGVVKIGERGAYIVSLVSRELDQNAYRTAREELRSRLARQNEQAIFADWEQYVRTNAKIEDYRDRFYNYD